MIKEPTAHITEDGRTHSLKEHLLKTAERAGEFAAAFGFRHWGSLAGLWHDIGKILQGISKKSSRRLPEMKPISRPRPASIIRQPEHSKPSNASEWSGRAF